MTKRTIPTESATPEPASVPMAAPVLQYDRLDRYDFAYSEVMGPTMTLTVNGRFVQFADIESYLLKVIERGEELEQCRLSLKELKELIKNGATLEEIIEAVTDHA